MPDNHKQLQLFSTPNFSDDKCEYVIKPFDISLVINNLDRSKAELTIEIRVSPAISAVLDTVKLKRLIFIILIITQTFTSASEPIDFRNVRFSLFHIFVFKNMVQYCYTSKTLCIFSNFGYLPLIIPDLRVRSFSLIFVFYTAGYVETYFN